MHFSLSTSGFVTANGRGFGMKPPGGAKGSALGTGMKPGGLIRGFCFVGSGLDFLVGMKPGGGVNTFCLGTGMKPGGGAKGSGLGGGMNPSGGVRGLDFIGGVLRAAVVGTDETSSVFVIAVFSSTSSTFPFSSSCFTVSSLRSWVRVRGRCSLVLPLPIRLVRPTDISSFSTPAAPVFLIAESVADAETACWLCSSVPAGTTRLTTLLTTFTTFLPLELFSSPGVSGPPITVLLLASSAGDVLDCGPLPVSRPILGISWGWPLSTSDWI